MGREGAQTALSGATIPIYARIALLIAIIDVSPHLRRPRAALSEAGPTGTFFDPGLVEVRQKHSRRDELWRKLRASAESRS